MSTRHEEEHTCALGHTLTTPIAPLAALAVGALTTASRSARALSSHRRPMPRRPRSRSSATNDFHGRILDNTSNGEAGAAVLAGAVKQLRAANPNTVFAAAGDLIGASTFESFIQHDKPTIDALNEAGLEVSAVGNHELDQGYATSSTGSWRRTTR